MDGSQAVNLFFVLSGFLITKLLLKELDETGTIHVGRFYIRRALRILPLYYLILSLRLLLPMILPSPIWEPLTTEYILGTAFLMNNVVATLTGFISITGVLWTISVEEWFYALWGFVVRSRWFLQVCVGIIIVRCVAELILPSLEPTLFSRTWGSLRFECMAVGALAAFTHTYSPHRFRWLIRPTLLPLIVALIILLALWSPPTDAFTNTIMSCFYVTLIAHAITHPGILEHRVLRWIGQRSYGIYMWHSAILTLCAIFAFSTSITLGIGLLGTLIVAHLSYTYFESPFLRLKDRFQYQLTPSSERRLRQ